MFKKIPFLIFGTVIAIPLVSSRFAYAADFVCHASKYPSGFQHAFWDGYTILSITGSRANLKYYYNNTVAGVVQLEHDADYDIGAVKTGKSKVAGYNVADVTRRSPLQSIDRLYIEPSLLNANPPARGIVGKFSFSGHGYSYDWNVCYAK